MEKMCQPPSVQAEVAESKHVFKTLQMHRVPTYQYLTQVDQHFSKSSLTRLLLAHNSTKLRQLTAYVNPTHGHCLRIFLGFVTCQMSIFMFGILCYYAATAQANPALPA